MFWSRREMPFVDSVLTRGLFSYIHGIVENNKSKLIIANGTMNHIHLLISLGRTMGISELIGDIKRGSSVWIKTQGDYRNFYWQEGYGAFSIGQSQVQDVVRYIQDQKEHHAEKDFKTEFRGLLKKYQVDYDERYVWD